MYKVEIQSGSPVEAFAAIRTEWQNLFSVADCSPFLSWEWMSTWYKSFGDAKELFLLKAYRDGAIAGILPTFVEHRRLLGSTLTILSLVGSGPGGADYLGPVAAARDSRAVTNAFLEFIDLNLDVDCVQFHGLDSASDFALAAKSRFSSDPANVGAFETVDAVCPQVNLVGGWDGVLAACKRKTNFRRRLKNLEGMDGFEFRSVTDPAEVEPAFERFLDLHNQRWQPHGGSELSGHPRLIAFQRRAVRELKGTGLLRFDELWLDGKCRSSVYAFEHRGTFYYYNAGYDAECSDLSVGLVLIGLSIRAAAERGVKVYDLLRGSETYKYDWANTNRTLISVGTRGSGFPAAAREWTTEQAERLVDFSRSALPYGLVKTLGGWRRTWRRSQMLSDR